MPNGQGRGRGGTGGRGRGHANNVKREKGGGGSGRGRQSKRHSDTRSGKCRPHSAPNKSQSDYSKKRNKVLLLHGNRQNGDVLLGRLDKLKKGLVRELKLDIVAPDAPHLFSETDNDCVDRDDADSTEWQRTWWHRRENTYQGLEESLSMLDEMWNSQEFVAILGFSQGSRLAHIISLIHTITNGVAFPGLKCVIHFSGYGDCPMPDNVHRYLKDRWGDNISSSNLLKLNDPLYNFDDVQVKLPSLHVMGETDKLIPLKSSEALLKWYLNPSVHVHPGNHYVPVKKTDVETYIDFLHKAAENLTPQSTAATAMAMIKDGEDNDEKDTTIASSEHNALSNTNMATVEPDDEHAQAQIDEVTALAQIFPTEFRLLSKSKPRDTGNYDPDDYCEENRLYEHPIKYSIILQPQDGLEQIEEQLWPPNNISLCIKYPAQYPDEPPLISLIHDMNYLEFSLQASDALLNNVREATEEEAGMPCVMSMVYAARGFFEEGGLAPCTKTTSLTSTETSDFARNANESLEKNEKPSSSNPLLQPSDAARIKECNAQGLQVAYTILGRAQSEDERTTNTTDETVAGGKGGLWRYTVGLVGKPSAGKSTFFNAATAFARQRGEGGGDVRCEDGHGDDDDDDDDGIMLGGASMAPHPFTTIDPNVGYCLIPAPAGACPEDDEDGRAILIQSGLDLGSLHGRDPKGRRFIPVLLKDVAGLVPGAYQGRGKGNKFLDDLTDADVLVHILDASGSSDAEGNKLLAGDGNHPINDLEWVRNELVEWVYSNLSSKWDSVVRRGHEKLIGMFSGYKQKSTFTYDVLSALESFVKENEGRDHIYDQLETWDEGDLHRLVSAFLGARFPMALALNKSDIPTATPFIKDIESALPIHGAHVGVSLSAHEEMKFIRHHLVLSLKDSSLSSQTNPSLGVMSGRVWDCLQSAVSLREPTLVFPVNDMKTYEPLPGMENYSTRDSSLPNHGFISCITAAGGCAPSQWNSQRRAYTPVTKDSAKPALRDVILMKPGSTVDDVFRSLKGMGCLEGEFVRAEGISRIGEKPKPVSKAEVVTRSNRILRIMTTRRQQWQKK